MRERGLSLQAIAEALNARGRPDAARRRPLARVERAVRARLPPPAAAGARAPPPPPPAAPRAHMTRPPPAAPMTALIQRFGPLGVFLLMVPESACIPVPSEVTLMFSGFAVGQHWMSLPLAILAATAGNVVGSLIAYAIGAIRLLAAAAGGRSDPRPLRAAARRARAAGRVHSPACSRWRGRSSRCPPARGASVGPFVAVTIGPHRPRLRDLGRRVRARRACWPDPPGPPSARSSARRCSPPGRLAVVAIARSIARAAEKRYAVAPRPRGRSMDDEKHRLATPAAPTRPPRATARGTPRTIPSTRRRARPRARRRGPEPPLRERRGGVAALARAAPGRRLELEPMCFRTTA